MKVTDVEVTVHRAERDEKPILAMFHGVPGLDSVRVVVRTDDGVCGKSEMGFGRGVRATDSLAAIIEHELKPIVVGSDLGFLRGTHQAMLRGTSYCGSTGLSLYAISLIDTALWDCLGKAHGVPCWQLWGAVRDRLPVYAMVAWINYSNDEVRRVCTEAVDHGFRAVKVQVGYPTTQEAVSRVQVVREAVGDDVKLMVDCNQLLSAPEAIRRGRAFEDLGCLWFEEPIPAHDIDGYAAVCEALDIPVAAGESFYGVADFARFLKHGAADIVQPNLRRAGGPTALLHIGSIAHAFDRPYSSSHSDGAVQASVMACLPNSAHLQADILQPTALPPLRDGHIPLPSGPGFDWE